MDQGSVLFILESEYEWVTHEAVITKDEVAIAIMGHRKIGTPELPADPANPGQEVGWGPSGTREKPTGLGNCEPENQGNDNSRTNSFRKRIVACEWVSGWKMGGGR